MVLQRRFRRWASTAQRCCGGGLDKLRESVGESSTANTLAGFQGACAVNGRLPTKQEIWDAGVRSGMRQAEAAQQQAALDADQRFNYKEEKTMHIKEGEIYIGAITSPENEITHIILLPNEFLGPWQEAIEWAESEGGVIPSSLELQVALAFCGAAFKPEPYWANENEDSKWARCLSFYTGNSYAENRTKNLNARAVRKVIINKRN